ncbi:MAG: hypothetical protein N3H31_04240 [Candidatus Nezhaarchaeota archaeon]|nr:hypothetical protein [Candidatus Nezhaarchaeota archaeon]
MPLEELGVKALNYGSRSKPRFTVEVKLGLSLEATPDEVHSAMVDEGVVSTYSIPCSATINFRGSSMGRSPYYEALVEHLGSVFEYQVVPEYIGGTVNTPIYRPLVIPKKLEAIHPVKFRSVGVRVLRFKLSNYFFTPNLERCREFYVDVRGGEELSIIAALFKESGLEVKAPPYGQVLCAFERSIVKLGGLALMNKILSELVK